MLQEKNKKSNMITPLHKGLNFNMKNFDIDNIYDAMVFSEKLLDNKLLLIDKAKLIGENFDKINRVIKNICDGNGTIGIYGSGAHGKVLYNLISRELEKRKLKVDCFLFDSNEKVIGEMVCDKKVNSYKDINIIKPSKLIIASYNSQEEIYRSIKQNINYEVEIIKLYDKDEEFYFHILID